MKLFSILIVSIVTLGRPLLAAESDPAEKAPERFGLISEIVFGGGTVAQLVDRLRQAGSEAKPPLPPLNVIVPDEMQNDFVPQFELHNVNYGDVFLALSSIRNTSLKRPIWRPTGNGKGLNETVWVLTPENPAEVSSAPRQSSLFQLQRYLSKYKIEDITTAIQTTWEMLGKEKGAQLKYHKDTSLLIAVGTREQLVVISQVLDSLMEGVALSAERAKKEIGMVTVNGAVDRPGGMSIFPDEKLDILGTIARAGGLKTRADENKIKFTRPGATEKTLSLENLKKDPKANIPVQPGDIIEVGEKIF